MPYPFKVVRQPIRDTMLRNPEPIGLDSPTGAEANLLVAAILQQRCEEELSGPPLTLQSRISSNRARIGGPLGGDAQMAGTAVRERGGAPILK